MACLRRRLVLAAASLAVIVAVAWLFSSRAKVQSGPDDDTMAPAGAPSPSPDDGVDPVFAFWMGFALGFPFGAASVSLFFYFFACGGGDDEEEAAGAKKVPCIVISVPGGCKN